MFHSTARARELGMDLDSLVKSFLKHGMTAEVREFSDIDFRLAEFKGKYVVYQSSEDRGLLYKDFIEDILLGVVLSGGILIPDFYKFRAHHNKVFMEVLRDVSSERLVQGVSCTYYGSLEEFRRKQPDVQKGMVIKASAGTGSRGVSLVRTFTDAMSASRRVSRSFHLVDWIKETIKRLSRPYHKRMSHHRRKFILQEFLPDLQSDFKILVYHDRFYVLQRQNRAWDFRASGSGMFDWPEEPGDELLDFAERVHRSFDVPMSSLDVARTENEFRVLEFQFLHFGPLTMEKAAFFFMIQDGRWVRIKQPSVVEEEFARSVALYIREKY